MELKSDADSESRVAPRRQAPPGVVLGRNGMPIPMAYLGRGMPPRPGGMPPYGPGMPRPHPPTNFGPKWQVNKVTLGSSWRHSLAQQRSPVEASSSRGVVENGALALPDQALGVEERSSSMTVQTLSLPGPETSPLNIIGTGTVDDNSTDEDGGNQQACDEAIMESTNSQERREETTETCSRCVE